MFCGRYAYAGSLKNMARGGMIEAGMVSSMTGRWQTLAESVIT